MRMYVIQYTLPSFPELIRILFSLGLQNLSQVMRLKTYCMEARAKLTTVMAIPPMTQCQERKAMLTVPDCDWMMKSQWICLRELPARLQAYPFPPTIYCCS